MSTRGQHTTRQARVQMRALAAAGYADPALSALLVRPVPTIRQWRRSAQRQTHYGIKRLVRDIWRISGRVALTETGQVLQMVLNQAAPLAAGLAEALRARLAPEGVAVSLGEI